MNFAERYPDQAIQPNPTLDERIAHWQAIFDKIPYDNVSTLELRATAVEELDSFWPHSTDYCAYKGIAKIEVGPDGEQPYHEVIDFADGWSQGFVIARIGSALTWRVCYGFEQEVTRKNGKPGYLQTYLLPQQAEIVPYQAVDEIYENIHLPQDIIDRAAVAMAEDVNEPEFMQLTAAEQRLIIDAKLFKARNDVARWGGMEKAIVVDQCDFVYIEQDGEHSGPAKFQKIYTGDGAITGECIGLDVLARYQLGRDEPIRTKAELVNRRAGLYLSIALNTDSARYFALHPNQCVYVPVGGNDLEVSFLEPDETDL